MIRRRRREPAPPPPPPPPTWRARVDDARRLIRSQQDQPWLEARLDALEQSLIAAEADHERLAVALAQLDPERATRELKDALRARDRGTGPDDSMIATLRRRYELVHQLLNQQEALRARIDVTVADLEVVAARSVELAVTNRADEARLGAELDRLHEDLSALEAAHREVRDL